jgi:hypothetical protein
MFKVYLSLGTKVSSVSCWKFGLLFGEPPYSGYFRKFAGTSLAHDSCL